MICRGLPDSYVVTQKNAVTESLDYDVRKQVWLSPATWGCRRRGEITSPYHGAWTILEVRNTQLGSLPDDSACEANSWGR